MAKIDMYRIEDVFGDDAEAIKQFMQSVLTNITRLLNEIKTIIDNKDQKAAKDAFHRLKGSTANCGLPSMSKLAKDAELAVIEEDWAATADLYGKILIDFDWIKIEMAEKFGVK